jgi:hypothetical protein
MKVRTLDQTVKELASVVSPVLISSLELSRIARCLEGLPESLTSYFGFECRLGNDSRTDFSIFTTPAWARRAFGNVLSDPNSRACTHPAWQLLCCLCEAWNVQGSVLADRVRGFWLEFDITDDGERPIPNVFASVGSDLPVQPMRGRCDEVVDRVSELGSGHRLRPDVRQTLTELLVALPADAEVRHLGVMLARPTNAVRICVGGMKLEGLPEFLTRARWAGPIADACAALSPLACHTNFMLAVDVGTQIGPKLGLELRLAFTPGSALAALTESLVACGACIPGKRDALMAWSGRTLERSVSISPPMAVDAALRLQGWRAMSTFGLAHNHIKVTYQPGYPVEAKAYLAVSIGWRIGLADGAATVTGSAAAVQQLLPVNSCM